MTAASAPETQAHIGGLAPGSEYEFRVFAVNSHGQSQPSESRAHIARAAAPFPFLLGLSNSTLRHHDIYQSDTLLFLHLALAFGTCGGFVLQWWL